MKAAKKTGRRVGLSRQNETARAALVVELLRKRGEMTTDEVAKALKWKRDSARSSLEQLAQSRISRDALVRRQTVYDPPAAPVVKWRLWR